MASKSSVKIDNDHVEVEPQLLFQRRIIAFDNSKLEEMFRYELCTYHYFSFQIAIYSESASKTMQH